MIDLQWFEKIESNFKNCSNRKISLFGAFN